MSDISTVVQLEDTLELESETTSGRWLLVSTVESSMTAESATLSDAFAMDAQITANYALETGTVSGQREIETEKIEHYIER